MARKWWCWSTSTNRGRIDMAVLLNGNVYLFELKVVGLVPDGRALQQLKDRGYAGKYRARGEPIHLIGVELSQDSCCCGGLSHGNPLEKNPPAFHHAAREERPG